MTEASEIVTGRSLDGVGADILTEQSFYEAIGDVLEREDASPWTAELALRDDLGVDSLTLVEIVTYIEERLCGVDAPDAVPALDTCADLYAYYRSLLPEGPLPPGPPECEREDVAGCPELDSTGDPEQELVIAWRSTPSFRLDPVVEQDVPFLYALAVAEDTGPRWIFRGTVPTPEVFRSTMARWASSFVVRSADDTPIGLVMAYEYHPVSGVVYLGAVMRSEAQGSRLVVEPVLLFMHVLFSTMRVQKITMEVPAYNMGQFAADRNLLRSVLDVEGVLKRHDWYGGQLWDRYYVSVWRDAFYRADFVRHTLRKSARHNAGAA